MKSGKNIKVGVLGGGQLGLMLNEAAVNMGIELFFLDPDPEAPCAKFGDHFTVGDFKNREDVLAFAKDKDLITIEIENVNTASLKEINENGKAVFPSPELIEIVKDKGLQKQFYQKHQIPSSAFILCKDKEECIQNISTFPVVQKLRTGGYDGKGVQIIRSENDFSNLFEAPSILEKFVPFEQEISVIVARNVKGEMVTFPSVGMQFNHEANLVEFLYSPAKMSNETAKKGEIIAKDIALNIDLVGIMAVEMFVTEKGLLVNEIAPRPHNSGHHSIEGNITSQYQQHLRAILDIELGDTSMTRPAVMVNLLGAKNHSGDVIYNGLSEWFEDPEVFIHLYGKKKTKPFRKMGHVTVLNNDLEKAIEKAERIMDTVSCESE